MGMVNLNDLLVNIHKYIHKSGQVGGLWISAGGGTANVIAGFISRNCGITFEQAQYELATFFNANLTTESENWYSELYHLYQDWEPRWGIEIPLKAALKATLKVA